MAPLAVTVVLANLKVHIQPEPASGRTRTVNSMEIRGAHWSPLPLIPLATHKLTSGRLEPQHFMLTCMFKTVMLCG